MKKKLNLNDLRVKSFVTAINPEETLKAKGASGECYTNPCITPVVASRDVDCFFTRFNNQCIVVVAATEVC